MPNSGQQYLESLGKQPQPQERTSAPVVERPQNYGSAYLASLNVAPREQQAASAPVERGYWENPGNIAMHYLGLQADTNNQIDWAANGVDPNLVETAYDYFTKTQGTDYTKWIPLPDTDAFSAILHQATAPPEAAQIASPKFQWTDILGQLTPAEAYQTTTQPALPQPTTPQLTPEQYSALPSWQKAAIGLNQSGVLSGMATMAPWAALGIGAAIVTGGTALPAVGLLGLGAAMGWLAPKPGDNNSIWQEPWDKLRADYGNQPWIAMGEKATSGTLYALNWLAEKAEQTFGTGAQLADAAIRHDPSLSSLLDNLPETFEANKLFYETAGAGIRIPGTEKYIPDIVGNIPAAAELLGEMLTKGQTDARLANPGLVHILGKPEPVAVPAMGFALLNMVRNEIINNPRTSPEEVIQKYRDAFGFSGQMNDMLYQTAFDPLNALPHVETSALKYIGKATNNPALQLAAETSARFSGGAIKTGQHYAEFLKQGIVPYSPDLKPIYTPLQRWIAGLTPEGKIAELTPGARVPPKSIAGALFYKAWQEGVNKLTPDSQMIAAGSLLIDNLSQIVNTVQDTGDIKLFHKYIDGILGMDVKDAAEVFKALQTPAMQTVIPMLKDFNYASLKKMRSAKELFDSTHMPVLRQVADGIGWKLRDVVDAVKTGETKALADAMLKAGLPDELASKLNPDSLTKLVKFVDANPYVVSDGHYMAHVRAKIEDFAVQKAPEYFGVKPGPSYTRFTAGLKSVQSAILLNMNPAYAVNNIVTNTVHRMYEGIGGFTTPGRIMDFYSSNGWTPSRLRDGYGAAEFNELGGQQLMTDLETFRTKARAAMKGKDLGQKMQDLGEHASNVLKLASKWSAAAEKMDSMQSMYSAHQKAFPIIWRGLLDSDAQFGADLRGELSKIGNPDKLYSALRGARSWNEVKSILGGAGKNNPASYLDSVATRMSEGWTKAVEETGVLDLVKERMNRGDSVQDAFIGADQMMLDKIRERFATEQPQIIQRITDAITHDPTELAKEFSKLPADLQETEIAHALATREMMETAAGLRGNERGKYITDQFNLENDRFTLQRQRRQAVYAGIAHAMGDSESAIAWVTRLSEWDKAIADFHATKMAKLKDTFKKLKNVPFGSEESNAIWTEHQAFLGAEYSKMIKSESAAMMLAGDHFTKMMVDKYGENIRTAANQYFIDWQASQEVERSMMDSFRAWERGDVANIIDERVAALVNGVDPNGPNKMQMWSRFYDELLVPARGETHAILNAITNNLNHELDPSIAPVELPDTLQVYRQRLADRMGQQQQPAPGEPQEVVPVAPTVENLPTMTRAMFQRQMADAFPNLTPDQVATVNELADALAKGQTWIDAGHTPEQWYAQFAKITNSTPEEMHRLMQEGGMLQPAPPPATPEFERFFDGSKLRDASGQPLILYHGTQADFTEFRITPLRTGFTLDQALGAHFSKDPNIANRFASGIYNDFLPDIDRYKGGNVMPVVAKMSKPKVINPVEGVADTKLIGLDIVATVFPERPDLFVDWYMRRNPYSMENIDKIFETLKSDPKEMAAFIDNLGEYDLNSMTTAKRLEVVSEYKRILKEQGYDGIQYTNTAGKEVKPVEYVTRIFEDKYAPPYRENFPEADPTCYIAFDGQQVKSVFNPTPNPDSPNIMFQSARGALEIAADSRAILHAFNASDISTSVHELAHVGRRYLPEADQSIVLDWVGEKEWNTRAEEQFADGFVKYLQEGKAPKPELKGVFDRFKGWLTDLWSAIRGKSGKDDPAALVQLSDEVRGVYDRMLTERTADKVEAWERGTDTAQKFGDWLQNEKVTASQFLKGRGYHGLKGEQLTKKLREYFIINDKQQWGDADALKVLRWVDDRVKEKQALANPTTPEDKVAFAPRSKLPDAVSEAVREQAEIMLNELGEGHAGRRNFTWVEYQSTPIVTGQESTNMQWYRDLYFKKGQSRTSVEAALNRIIEDKGKDDPRFRNVLEVKELILNRLSGYTDPLSGEDIPGNPAALLFMNKPDLAAEALMEWMGHYPEGAGYENMVKWAGSDENLSILIDLLGSKETPPEPITGEPPLFQRGNKPLPGQMGFFDKGEELPLFTGTAPKGQESVFKPTEQVKQETLFPMAPEMKGGKKAPEKIGNYVYFYRDGELYKAPADAPLDINGYPLGARWEAPAHLAEQRMEQLRGMGKPQGTLFQEEPTSQLLPGAYETLGIDQPLDSDIYSEAFLNIIKPTMLEMQRQMMTDPAAGGSYDFNNLSPRGQQLMRKYIADLKRTHAQAFNATIKIAESQRDMALLNYNKRYNFDHALTAWSPYQFWFTRSMQNWALRAIDKPGILSFFARMAQSQDQHQIDQDWMPARLKGKVRIPFAGIPDWAGGGLYFDPLSKAIPFMEFLRPFEQMRKESSSLDNKVLQLIRGWQKDGQITQAEMDDALNNKTGVVWEKAASQVQSTEGNDALDIMGLFLSPALYLTVPYKLATGRGKELGPYPPSRLLQAISGALGSDFPANLNPERLWKKDANIADFGNWGDYYVNRQLSNMAAEGTISAQEANEAMVTKNGTAYEEAVMRVRQETMMKVPGGLQAYEAAQFAKGQAGLSDVLGSLVMGWLPNNLLPTGELKQRGLWDEYNTAWKAYHQGNKQAINTFFDEHPEYSARLALYKEPDEQLHGFLTNEVWDRYTSMPDLYKKQVQAQLGDDFRAFLSGNDEGVENQQLADWAKSMGGDTAGVEANPQGLQLAPEAQAVTYQDYMKQFDQAFPGLRTAKSYIYSLPQDQQEAAFGKLPGYYQSQGFKYMFMSQHPEMIPFIASEEAKYAGADPAMQQAVVTYYAERYLKFPENGELLAEYYSYPKGSKERKALGRQYPSIYAQFDWQEQYQLLHPEIKPYISSNEIVVSNADTTVKPPEIDLAQQIAKYPILFNHMRMAAAGGKLTAGDKSLMRLLWERNGKPYGTFTEWMQAIGVAG